MLSANKIIALHDRLTHAWHVTPDEPLDSCVAGAGIIHKADDFWSILVARQHRANFDLWHIEDEARMPDADDARIAAVKRRIDKTNQLRNDLAEELDIALLNWLESRGFPNPSAPLHSEPPGMMIDRLSILALKIYHTRLEAARTDAPEDHSERNKARLVVLEQQRADLASCLDALWHETLAGVRRFKLYRQLKMYNDPTLNPAIYGSSVSSQKH